MSSLLVGFFVNPRTKQPTVCGWLVTLLFMSVLINVLLSKISRHNTEERDQVINDQVIKGQVVEDQVAKDQVAGLHDVHPRFRNFPTPIPGRKAQKISRLFEDNIDDKEDIQPIHIPVFDQNGAMPVFDPNLQRKKKPVVNEDMKKGGNRVTLADHQKPQPKVFPVNVLLKPDISCEQERTLLMIIFSRVENRGGRSAIRSTWARYSGDKYPSAEVRWTSIFVIGRAQTDWLEEEVKNENKKHHDLLQGDFIDSPYEDTRKFMLALKWLMESSKLTNECQVRYILKSKDNIFHNMNAISGWLNAKFSKDDVRLYVGRLLRKDTPSRDPDDPLYVSPADYPKQFFPDLIQAPVYLFSYDTLKQMNKVMGRVTPIAMEDAYVGLLAERGGITPRHNDHFQMLTHIREGCHYLRMFFIYDVLPNDHLVVDRNIDAARHSKKCAVRQRYNHIEA